MLFPRDLRVALYVGERSNFKKFPTHTQDHGDAQQREGRVLSTYQRRPTAEAITQSRGSSRTSSRSNRSKHRYSGTFDFLTHVQLDDAPRAPIQQSFGEEFRQHDGVVTILMCYRRRALPKHYNGTIEVEFGGRGHRTRLRNDLKDQLVCSRVPPCARI